MNFLIEVRGTNIYIIDTKTFKDVKEKLFDLVFDDYDYPDRWTYELASKLLELYNEIPEFKEEYVDEAI